MRKRPEASDTKTNIYHLNRLTMAWLFPDTHRKIGQTKTRAVRLPKYHRFDNYRHLSGVRLSGYWLNCGNPARACSDGQTCGADLSCCSLKGEHTTIVFSACIETNHLNLLILFFKTSDSGSTVTFADSSYIMLPITGHLQAWIIDISKTKVLTEIN